MYNTARAADQSAANKSKELDLWKMKREELKDKIVLKQKTIRRLNRLARTDHENNEREQKRQYGKPLMFGDNVQLKHLYTNEFISFSPSQTSLLEYNTMRVTLQPKSDHTCFFRLMPKFKVRAEGDNVMPGDQVVFISDAANGYSITRTRKAIGDVDDGRADKTIAVQYEEDIGSYEVCMAAESKGWVIDAYTAAEEGTKLKIHGGDFIQLEDRELDGHLSAGNMMTTVQSGDQSTLKGATRDGVFAPFLNKGVDDDGGLKHESASYWQLELFHHKERGDSIEYDNHEFLLRHADTGAYLAVDGDVSTRSGSEDQFDAYLVDPQECDDAACIFSFTAIRSGTSNNLDDHVLSGVYSRLRHVATNSYFTSRNSELGMVDKELYDQLQAKDGKITATDIQLLKSAKQDYLGIGFKREVQFEDCLMIRRVAEADADDFAYAHGLKENLVKVVRATSPAALWSMESFARLKIEAASRGIAVRPTKQDIKHGQPIFWDSGGKQVVEHGIFVLNALAAFLRADGGVTKIGKDYKDARYKRQGLLQDMGIIELIVQVLKAPLNEILKVLPIERRGEAARQLFPELQQSIRIGSDAENPGDGLWGAACHVLLEASWGEATSTDRYIAQYYEVFCLHMMYLKTKNSSGLLIELFDGNRDIIDDLLDDAYGGSRGHVYDVHGQGLDWILNHLQLDVQGVIDHHYWNFLATVCVCGGLAVSRAQEKVWVKLQTGDAFNILHQRGNFVQLTSYPDTSGKGIVIGFIPRQGVPPLGLNRIADASTDSIIQVVAGDDAASSETVTYTEVSKYSSSDAAAVSKTRLQYDFLLSNLNICRALCTNHSRVAATSIVPRIVSEDILLALIFHEKNSSFALPYDLKAVVMELAHALYVDVAGALTVFDDDLREFVYRWHDLSAGELAATTRQSPDVVDSLEARASYLDGVAGNGFGFMSWFTSGSDGSSGVGRRSGFSTHLYDFAWQMKYLNTSDDLLKPWHAQHSKFINACLKQMYTFVSGGLVKDSGHVRSIVKTLVNNLLVFVPYLVTGEKLVVQEDIDRNEIICVVLESALNVIELLEIQAQDTCLETLYKDFQAMFNGTLNGYAAAAELKGIIPLQGMLFQTKEKETVMTEESKQFSAFAITADQRSRVLDYLRKLLGRGGSSSVLAGIDIMLKNAADAAKADAGAAKQRADKKKVQSIVTFREKQEGKVDSSDKAYVEKMTDLLIYIVHQGVPLSGSNIVMAAMKVVWLKQSRTTAMCLNGITVRILVDQESVHARRVAVNILPELHYLVYHSQIHDNEAIRLLALLQQLMALLEVGNGNKYAVKEVLFRMNLLTVVLGLFDQSLDDQDTLATDATPNVLQRCIIQALEFIGALTEDHTEAQERMFDEMQHLLENESVQTPRIMGRLCDALRHVFVANPKNQVSIREQNIVTAVDTLCKFQQNSVAESSLQIRLHQIPALLQSFAERHVDLYGSTPSSRNQKLIISEIMKKPELVQDMQNACNLPDRYAPRSQYAPLWQYHLGIISLLATLADGEDEHIESICENLVNVNQILNTLAKISNAREPMPRALVEFLHQVFLSENCVFDVDTKYLMRDANLWQVTAELADDLRRELPHVGRVSTRKYIFGSVLPLLTQIVSLFLRMEGGVQTTGKMGAQQQGHAVVNIISSAVEYTVAIIIANSSTHWWNRGHLEKCTAFIIIALDKARPPATTEIQFQEIVDKVPDPWPKPQHHVTSQEDVVNQAFSSFTATLWEVYANQNADVHECHVHIDANNVRNCDCLYLERDEDGRTALPCGDEFCDLVNLFDGAIESQVAATSSSVSASFKRQLEAHSKNEPGYVALLRYLGFLKDTMTDISVSTDDRERAEVLCMSTLDMLKALLQKFRCNEQQEEVVVDPTGPAGVKLEEQLAAAQSAHAKAGAVSVCLELICAEEDELMQSAFRYLMMLTYGGNMNVQAELVRALQDSASSGCLLRIREELSRCVSALVQLVKGDAHHLGRTARGVTHMLGIDSHRYLADVDAKDKMFQVMVDKMTTVDNWTPVRAVNVNAIVHSDRSFVGYQGEADKAEAIAFGGAAVDGKSTILTFKTHTGDILKFTRRASEFWIRVGHDDVDVNSGSHSTLKHVLMKKGCATWGSSSTPAKGGIIEEVWEQEYYWAMDLAEGVQAIAEGAYAELQDLLRDNSNLGSDLSANVLVELVRILAIVYPYMGSDKGSSDVPHGWIKLTKQLLDTISEVCQGNQMNQQEVLDERIISMLNAVIAFDTDDYTLLELLTETKRSAISILKAMTEETNDVAHGVANSLLSLLNKEELYLAMNRFYYIDMFINNGEAGGDGKHSSVHLKAGREAFQIFARLRDLTGHDPLPWKESTKQADMTEVAKEDWEEKRNDAMRDVDKGIWDTYEELWEEFWDSHKETLSYKENSFEEGTQEGSKLKFKMFADEFLEDLDDHGSDNLTDDADRRDFFEISTICIEFIRHGNVQRLYFEAPTTELSKTVREMTLDKLDLGSPQEKVRSFLEHFEDLGTGLRLQKWLRKRFLTRQISEGTGPYWQYSNLFLSYFINVLLLASYSAPCTFVAGVTPAGQASTLCHTESYSDPENEAWFENWLKGVGYFHFISSIVIVAEFAVNNLPGMVKFVRVNGPWSTGLPDFKFATVPTTLGFFMEILYYSLFLGLSGLGLWGKIGDIPVRSVYAFHLLHLLAGNQYLSRGVSAITQNTSELLMLVLLMLSVLYIFALLAFHFFRQDFDEESGQFCSTLAECFVTTVTWGVTHGGGLREVLSGGDKYGFFGDPHYKLRVVVDLFFWMVVSTIMMNLLLGIIVDTFGRLRTEEADQISELSGFCFICSLPAHSFEHVGGFRKHIKREHNMWSYLYFVEQLKKIEKVNMSYQERYLYDHLVGGGPNMGVKVFPIKQALELQDAHDETTLDGKFDHFSTIVRTMQKQLTDLQSYVRDNFEEQAVNRKRQMRMNDLAGKNAMGDEMMSPTPAGRQINANAGIAAARLPPIGSTSGGGSLYFSRGFAAVAQDPEETAFGFTEDPEDTDGYLDLIPDGSVVSAPVSLAASQLVARRQELDERRADLESRRRRGDNNRF